MLGSNQFTRTPVEKRTPALIARRDRDRKAGPRPIVSRPDRFGVSVPALRFLERGAGRNG